MSQDDVFDTIASCIRTTFRQSDLIVTRATTADDVDGWDSLAHATLMFRIEKKLNVRIPREIASAFDSVGSLADAVCQLKGIPVR